MTSFDVLIVGGGHAGVALVGQLRKSGYGGTVGVLESGPHLPYERPPLSKGYMVGDIDEAELLLRQPEYWDHPSTTLRTSSTVASIDPIEHHVVLESGEHIGYGVLVVATGAAARQLILPGATAGNVLSIRTVDDARRLRELAQHARRAVIIGGGYIGLETAATLTKLGVQVTVLEAADRLLARVAGPVLADFLRREHEAHGVRVITAARIASIDGADGQATAVVLDDGERLPADIVVVGVGVDPRVAILEEAGAETANGVLVDEACRTSLPDVYAIGDIATQINSYFLGGERFRLESVPNVTEHAKFVTAAILGQDVPERAVPWFWSNQYDLKLQTAGILSGFDEEIVRECADGVLVVGYFRAGVLIAADTIGAPRDFSAIRTLLGRPAPVSTDQFRDRETDLIELSRLASKVA